MTPNNHIITVRIDSKAQKARREKTDSGILLAENHVFMQRNLQNGIITSIGARLQQKLPDLAVGDYAVFHHTIEDADDRLLLTEENGDKILYLTVFDTEKCDELYAVIKADGTFIPMPRHIFLTGAKRKLNVWKSDHVKFHIDLEDKEIMKSRLAELDQHRLSLAQNFEHLPSDDRKLRDEQIRALEPSMEAFEDTLKESERITKEMNKTPLVYMQISYIHPDTASELGLKKDDWVMLDERHVYPIEIGKVTLVTVAKERLWAVETETNAIRLRPL